MNVITRKQNSQSVPNRLRDREGESKMMLNLIMRRRVSKLYLLFSLFLSLNLILNFTTAFQYTRETRAIQRQDDGYDDDNNSGSLYVQRIKRNNSSPENLSLFDRRKHSAKPNSKPTPSYQLISSEIKDSPRRLHHEFPSLLRANPTAGEWPEGNENDVDFSKELVSLSKKSKIHQSRKNLENSEAQRRRTKRPLATSPDPETLLADLKGRNASSLLGQDSYTVNLLLNMLVLANRKCADKHKESVAKLREISSNSTGHQLSTASPFSRDEETSDSLESSTRLNSTLTGAGRKRAADQSAGQAGAAAASSPQRERSASEPPGSSEADQRRRLPQQRKSLQEAEQKARAKKEDHELVRPGGYDMADKLSASQDMSQVAALRFPSPIGLEFLGQPAQEQEIDLLRNHKPINPRDLLDVHRDYNRNLNNPQANLVPHHYPAMVDFRPHAPRTFSGEIVNENLLYPRRKSPLLEFLQRSPEQVQTPYNGNFPVVDHGYAGGSVDEHEGNNLAAGPFPGSGPLNKPPVSLNGHFGTLMGNELELQNQPHIPEENQHPINQMLMAVKNQQAAALVYEKKRLEHEQELQKEAERIRLKHEEQLQRQRLEAQKLQQEQEKEEQKKKKEEQQPADDANRENNHQSEEEANGEGNQEEQNQGQNHEEQPEQENQQQQQEDHENDPEMKSLKKFADTDFTDLFPPGILSQEEIKEMRKQQEESRKKQAEEEQEES